MTEIHADWVELLTTRYKHDTRLRSESEIIEFIHSRACFSLVRFSYPRKMRGRTHVCERGDHTAELCSGIKLLYPEG